MLFQVDPYSFQPPSFDREVPHSRDIAILADFFDKFPQEIIDASVSFKGRPNILLRFIFSIQFLATAFESELSEEAETLAVCAIIFTIEGVVQGIAIGKGLRLRAFFLSCLNRLDKEKLLSAYTFTKPYPLGGSLGGKWRHLMFGRVIKEGVYREEDIPHCLPSIREPSCVCVHWLKDKKEQTVDRLVGNLSEKLYDMRSSVVHDGQLVNFVAPTNATNPGIGSTLDAYATDDLTKMVSYHSAMKRDELLAIAKNGLWECFKQGAIFPRQKVS